MAGGMAEEARRHRSVVSSRGMRNSSRDVNVNGGERGRVDKVVQVGQADFQLDTGRAMLY
jgi:hypothetical protein